MIALVVLRALCPRGDVEAMWSALSPAAREIYHHIAVDVARAALERAAAITAFVTPDMIDEIIAAYCSEAVTCPRCGLSMHPFTAGDGHAIGERAWCGRNRSGA